MILRLGSRLLSLLLAVAIASSHLTLALPALAQDSVAPASLAESLTGAALTEYEAARLLYQDGDYHGARLKFERAHELSGDPRLLWNMAAADKNLRRYASVLRLLDRYLAEGGARVSDEDRADAQALIRTVQAFVARVTVKVDQPDAEISIDGEAVGRSPMEQPILVDMGTRRLRVSKPGFREFEESRKLSGNEEITIEVALVEQRAEGTLRVVAGVGDVIRVDGKLVGRGQWEGKLPSGTHSLSVTAPGKLPYQTDVIVSTGQLVTSRVSLESEPRAADPTRDKESGPPWGWIAAGAVLAAGIGVGAYFLFRKDAGEPSPITGTLPPGAIQLGSW
jgi:hypothetical protein